MSDRRDGPYYVDRGYSVYGTQFSLIHREWHPCGMMGDIAQPETMVQRGDGSALGELIQHGWSDFKAAETIICKALLKGWDVYRIGTLMDWLRDRKRPFRPFFL